MKRGVVIECVAAVAVIAVLVAIILLADSKAKHPAIPTSVIKHKPVADPFVYHRIGNARLVRAVAEGKLYIFLFRHIHGVWVFVGAKSITELELTS